jgi:hypothetical protein
MEIKQLNVLAYMIVGLVTIVLIANFINTNNTPNETTNTDSVLVADTIINLKEWNDNVRQTINERRVQETSVCKDKR